MDKTALSIAELSSWMDLGENFRELLDVLIREKTVTPVNIVRVSIESSWRIVRTPKASTASITRCTYKL